MKSLAMVMTMTVVVAAFGQEGPLRSIDSKRHFLGALGPREWQEHDGRRPEGREMRVVFQAKGNSTPATLFIRQEDAKLDWPVKLNETSLGRLERIENDLIATLTIPAGVLKDGENVLHILPAKAPDDLVVGEIHFDPRAPTEAISEATVTVRVSEKGGGPLPCRLTIVDEDGCLVPVTSRDTTRSAARAGVVYTANGEATIGLRKGRYTLHATRGFEYSLASQTLDLNVGDTKHVALELVHEVPTPGLVACDTHVHSLEFSKHGDATAAERAMTVAGEGIELPIATDHNVYADYEPAARATDTLNYFTPVIGCEVTTPKGHFNAFPVKSATSPLPNHKLENWPELMASIRAVPGMQVIILNHPRDVHSNFIPFAPENFNAVTGENLRGPAFSFDAMEIANSGALQSDLMQTFRDWFALLNNGLRLTAVASSDCHDVSRFIVGQGRSYVAVNDDAPATIDVAAACRSFKEGRVYPSLGLLTRMTIDGKHEAGDLAKCEGEEVRVEVTVLGPTWIDADQVTLYQNGVKVREQAIDAKPRRVEKLKVTWKLPLPKRDAHLVAIASGPGPTGNYWNLASPYQPTGRFRKPQVMGATNPVWLDADGDGKFTAARLQAEALLEKVDANSKAEAVLALLVDTDAPVASQGAALLQRKGYDLTNSDFQEALSRAAEPVQTGFRDYLATQKD